MSELRVDDIVDKEGLSAPTFSKGAIVTGVTTASGGVVGNVTGDVTGTLTGTASGLAGSPDITVGDVGSTNETVSKQLSSEHIVATGIVTASTKVQSGVGTFTTSTVVGSAVTSNSDGIVAAGIVTAGTCFKTGNGVFGAGIGATITGSGDAVFSGVCTATSFIGDGAGLTGLSIPSSFTWVDSNLF